MQPIFILSEIEHFYGSEPSLRQEAIEISDHLKRGFLMRQDCDAIYASCSQVEKGFEQALSPFHQAERVDQQKSIG